jgi:hypothetical protein
MDFTAQKALAKKTAYAAVGAPVVVTRKMKDLGSKMMTDTQTIIDEYVKEGEKVTKQLRERNVVEELEQRMSIDKMQDRVEQLRDQLENTLSSWRESFNPQEESKKEPAKPAAKKTPVKKAAAKPAAKKTPAKKAATKPAAKKTAAKPTAKKTPAKTAASK